MVVEQLRDDANSNVTVVEFDPWMYSDTGDVVSALFRTIAQSLSGFGTGITALGVRHVLSVVSDFSQDCLVPSPPRMPQWPRPVKYYLKDSKVCRKSLNRIPEK